MTKSIFKEEEKKYIPLIEGLPMFTPINAQGSAQVGLGVQVKSVFKPAFKTISESEEEPENPFDVLNEKIEKNYKQYQNLTKKLESYQAEYDYAPDNIKPSIAANFNKLVNQHNDLAKQLQGDIVKRDQIITTTDKINFMKYKQLTGLPGEVGKTTPLPGPKPIIEGLPISTIPNESVEKSQIYETLKKSKDIFNNNVDYWKQWFKELKESDNKWNFLIGKEHSSKLSELKKNAIEMSAPTPEKEEEVGNWINYCVYGMYFTLLGSQAISMLNTGVRVKEKLIKGDELKGVLERASEAYVPETGNFKSTLSDNDYAVMKQLNIFLKTTGKTPAAREMLEKIVEQTGGLTFPQKVNIFGVKLYGGLPADEIAKSIVAIGKVTADMVKGLDVTKVMQVTQQLLDTSPALATAFLQAVEKSVTPEVKKEIPKAEIKEPIKTKEELRAKVEEPVMPKELQPLAEETKNYKTEEEWEKAIYNSELKTIPKAPVPYNQMGNVVELTKSAGFKSVEDFYNQVKKIEVKAPVTPNIPKAEEPKKVEPTIEEIPKTIPKELEPLAEEARKYESAEEFKIGLQQKLDNLWKQIGEAPAQEQTKLNDELQNFKQILKNEAEKRMTPEALKLKETGIKKIARVNATNDFLTDLYTQATAGIKAEGKAEATMPVTEKPAITEPEKVITEPEKITEAEIKVEAVMPEEKIEKPIPKELKNDYLKIIGKDIKLTPDRLELIKDIRQDIPISEELQIKYPDLVAKIPQANFAEIQDITKRPPTAEKILGIKKAPLIARREDILLRQRIRDEARGAREGSQITREDIIAKFKSSQENIKNIKNDLIKYIDENLPTEAKGRFIHPLTMENLTRKKAVSIFSRVDRVKESLERKELVSEIKKLSIPKGNLAVDYQKMISETIARIDLVKPTQNTLRKLKGLQSFIQKNGIPLNIQSKYLERLDRLTKKNVGQLSINELAELKDTLNQLQKLGKLKQYLRYKYHERERKVALNKLLNSTKNIDPKVSGRNTKSDIFKIGTKEVYMDTLHTPRVADMIDGFKGYKGENAKYIKELGRKETEAKEITRAIVNSALEEIQDLGIKELTEEQQIRMMINIRYREGAFDQVKTLMEKNNLKEIPNITDQENKIIEIIKKYTTQYTDDIVAVFEEIENTPFNKLKEYILPIKYEKEFNLIPSQVIEQGRFRTTQTFKGFTFERQKGVEKTPRTDILAIFEEAINEQQWYLKMQPELENIKYLVKSKEYIVRGGQMAANWWKDQLDIVARRGWSATARSNPILRQARINLNQAILGYKISSVVIQPFAVFDAMAYTQSRYGTIATLKIIKEFSKAWIIPKYAKNIIAKSPALQQRQAGELAIEETLKKVGKTKGLWNSYIRGGMALLQKGDIITAAGVQKGMENILIKNKTLYVKEEAEFLMNLVSGSNEIVYRPHILAKGEVARTWFTFQTFFLNRWGILIHDLIQSGVLRGGGEAGWKRLWMSMTALIGLGIFIAGSIAEEEARKAIYEKTTGKELPDESTLKTAMMFIPEQIPYFGNLIELGGNANPPVIRTAENVFSGGLSVIKGKTTETKIKGALRMTEAGLTLGVGVPGTAQAFDLLENIFREATKKKTGAPVGRIDIKKELGIGGRIDIEKELGIEKGGRIDIKKELGL